VPPSYQTVYGVNGYTLTGLPWALPAAARLGRAAERLPEPLPPSAQSVRPGVGRGYRQGERGPVTQDW